MHTHTRTTGKPSRRSMPHFVYENTEEFERFQNLGAMKETVNEKTVQHVETKVDVFNGIAASFQSPVGKVLYFLGDIVDYHRCSAVCVRLWWRIRVVESS